MNEFVLNHPLITHKLAILRDINTGTKEFRELVTEISTILMYEAMRDAKLEKTTIETPLEKMETGMIDEDNYAIVPILLFHIFMILDCINNNKFVEAIIIGCIMLFTIIYSFLTYESDYMMAIYSENKQFDNYQNKNNISIISGFNNQIPISHNEIIKWTNKYRHPLIIPAFIDEDQDNNIIQTSYFKNIKNINTTNKYFESIQVRPFEPKNRTDE